MEAKDKALSALMAAFPTSQDWARFSQEGDNALIRDSVVNFAFRSGLIKTADTDLIEALINQHASYPKDLRPTRHLDFKELLDQKEDLLKINLSLRALTQRINALLTETQIALPKITNSMLTRLKKEPVDTTYKQNVLRSLAFWLGHERADIASDWHYGILLAVCREGQQNENYKEGARIGFAFYSRGDVIDHEILGWLRKTLKNYIDQSIGHFSYGRWGKVRAHDITTFYVDFPKEETANDPVAYRQCLRSAVSLSHQIAIGWALSGYSTKNRFLSIAIVVGEYANLDNHLLPLLNAKLPDDPVVRLSDATRQSVLINDIRVILCPTPTETTLFNGEILTIWWIEAFWSTLYFDFVPELLADPILKSDPGAIENLNRLLWKYQGESQDAEADKPNAVAIYFKVPHNSLLGVEIAKTLYYRHRLSEALEILRMVLSINPTDMVARTLRMILLRNIALDAPTIDEASGLFRQAHKEAQFIQAHCACESEDFYCEYAVVYMAQAMSIVRHTRTDRESSETQEVLKTLKKSVFRSLDTAEDLLENAIVVSPSGIRSAYLLSSVRLLRAILKEDEDIFINPSKPLTARPQTGRDIIVNVLWQIGFRRSGLTEDEQNDITEKLMIARANTHDDAISLQSYRPTIYFCHAVALWDFLPVHTLTAMERAREILRKAIEIAESVKKDDVCIYSFSRTYGEMIPADEFIHHMKNCLRLIDATFKSETAMLKGKAITRSAENSPLSLMTLNF